MATDNKIEIAGQILEVQPGDVVVIPCGIITDEVADQANTFMKRHFGESVSVVLTATIGSPTILRPAPKRGREFI